MGDRIHVGDTVAYPSDGPHDPDGASGDTASGEVVDDAVTRDLASYVTVGHGDARTLVHVDAVTAVDCDHGDVRTLADGRPAGTVTAHEIVDHVGLTYRQVDYLTRQGLTAASHPAAGSGTRRFYTAADVVPLILYRDLRRLLTPDGERGFGSGLRDAVADVDLQADRYTTTNGTAEIALNVAAARAEADDVVHTATGEPPL